MTARPWLFDESESTSPELSGAESRRRMTRKRLLGRALVAIATYVGVAGRPRDAQGATSVIRRLTVRNASKSFVGDRRDFATISPRSAGPRSGAVIDLFAQRRVDATLEVVNRNGVGVRVLSRQPVALAPGRNQIPWTPKPGIKPGSYILRLRELDQTPAPVLGSAVVRVMDVEATFRRRSALPGEQVTLHVQSDAPWLRMTLLRCGPESGPTNSNYEMRGVPVGIPDASQSGAAGSRRRCR